MTNSIRMPCPALLGWALMLLVLVLFFVPLPSVIQHDRLFDQLGLVYHFGAFSALTAWISYRLGLAGATKFPTWCLLGCILLIAAFTLEYVQTLFGRSADSMDVIAGSLGILSAMAWRSRLLSLPWFIIVCLASFVPSMLILADRLHARQSFPVLADFSSPLEMGRWKTRSVTMNREQWDGASVAHIEVQASSTYGGLFMIDFPRDWSRISALRLRLYLEGEEPLPGWIRIDDHGENPAYDDRYQESITLAPGWNEIHISRTQFAETSGGRVMNLSHVQTWGLFFHKSHAGRVVKLDQAVLALNP